MYFYCMGFQSSSISRVNSEDIVKISDGSFSPDLYPDEYLYKTGFYLPVRWMAPESLKQLGFYHAKSDVVNLYCN